MRCLRAVRLGTSRQDYCKTLQLQAGAITVCGRAIFAGAGTARVARRMEHVTCPRCLEMTLVTEAFDPEQDRIAELVDLAEIDLGQRASGLPI